MVPKYLKIDAMLAGTGIRDGVEGGYYGPEALGLSASFTAALDRWLISCRNQHHSGFPSVDLNSRLNSEGIALADRLSEELPGTKVGYFSDALAKELKPLT